MQVQTVNFDGQDRKLYYGLDELQQIEDYHGLGIAVIVSPLKRGIGTTVSLLWGGLSRFSDEYKGIQGRKNLSMKMEEWLKQGNQAEKLAVLAETIDKAMKESGVFPSEEEVRAYEKKRKELDSNS